MRPTLQRGRAVLWRRCAQALAVLVVVASCTDEVPPPQPIPSTSSLLVSPATTRFRDTSSETLPTIVGSVTTTTLGIVGGESVLSGQVIGPGNIAIAGAVVRVERAYLEGQEPSGPPQATEVVTAPNGTFAIAGLVGGRLRVRAWKAPSLAMPEDQVMFLGDKATVALTMELFAGTQVRWSAAPDIPRVGRRVNLAVQVAARTVDEKGLVAVRGVTETEVRLVPLGGLQPLDDAPRLTDADGRVVWELVCRQAGPTPLLVILATGEETKIEPPDCVRPITTTTEAPIVPETTPLDETVPEDVSPVDTGAPVAPVQTLPPETTPVPVPIPETVPVAPA